MPRKICPSLSPKCTPTLYRSSARYYCCSTISSSNLRRTVGFSLCSIDAFSPRLVLSPSLFPPRFTRETYTLHAIVHDDSVRIHVYARTRKAAPFAGDSESKRRSFVRSCRWVYSLYYSLLYYSVHLTIHVNCWPLNSTPPLFYASLIYLKICKYA